VREADVQSARFRSAGLLDMTILTELMCNTPFADVSARNACESAVEHLAWLSAAMTLLKTPDGSSSGSSNNMLISWPIRAKDEYVRLLQQLNGQALVVLAFYGVLLHQRRRSWMIGDSALFLVNSIARHLGPTWERWLDWPVRMVATIPL
jgi:hypothetical protein